MRRCIASLVLILMAACLGVEGRASERWILTLGDTSTLEDPWVGDMAAMPDGSTLMLVRYHVVGVGDNFEFFLVHTDRHGNPLWTKYLGKSTPDSPIDPEGRSLLPLSDGTFLLFLHVEGGFSPDCGVNAWGCKMDASGEVMWQRYFQLNDSWWSLEAFETDSGRVLLTTAGGELDELDLETGDLLWERKYWAPYPSPQYDFAATQLEILREDSEGALYCVGFTPIFPVHSETAIYLVKLDAGGTVQWAISYTSGEPGVSLYATVIPRSQGGYWMYGNIQREGENDYADRGLAGRLSEMGDVLWTHIYSSWDEATSSGFELRAYSALDVGESLLVGGDGYDGVPGYRGLTGTVGADGEPLMELWTTSSGPDHTLTELLPKPDGGALGLLSKGIVSLGADYRLPPSCSDYMAPDCPYIDFSVVKGPGSVYSGESELFATCPTNQSFPEDDRLNKVFQFCGEAYPGIARIKTLKGPFRLKLYGWNFQPGSRVFIDGAEVPAVKFKGQDKKTGMTMLVVKKGRPLKEMVPKAQEVSITVYNPDGKESVEFLYSR